MSRISTAITALCTLTATVAPLTIAAAQMVTGRAMPGYNATFGLTADKESRAIAVHELSVRTSTGEGANVLWPGEQATYTFTFTNKSAKPVTANGAWELIPYGTSVRTGDIWTPHVFPLGKVIRIPLTVTIPANGDTTITVTPPVPTRFGGYALIADLGTEGRLFAATMVRVPRADPGREQFPTYALDIGWPYEVTEATAVFFERIGIKGCRMGASFKPASDGDIAGADPEFSQQLDWANKHNITVMLTLGEGGAAQPLGRPRPWLDEKGVLLDTKSDYAWLPSLDGDFRKWTTAVVNRWGWPRGPVNAVELWNEPWEGISISGWGADMLRYREIYRTMALGVVDARQNGNVNVLIGGTCSSSNTRDKLFSDGTLDFLPYLDFVSIHYQPLSADPVVEKIWAERQAPSGPVRVWDTESWIANSEDRVAAVIASMWAQGQERTAGIYGGNVFESQVLSDKPRRGIIQAWSPAAAVAASQKFIGQRRFKEILFKNGLPWIFRFEGTASDEGTLVVVGDLGGVYERNRVLWRTVSGQKNQTRMEAARKKLESLPVSATEDERKAAEDALASAQVLEGATLTMDNPKGEFILHDFYGNPVAFPNRKLIVPLNGLGYFLRTTGASGSFARLLEAVRRARIDGYTPVEIVLHDFTQQLAAPAVQQITVHNILNRQITGNLNVRFEKGGESVVVLALKPFETRTVRLKCSVPPVQDNRYHCTAVFDAGKDGVSRHSEVLHANLIAQRSIQVDGDLSDWQGVPPQPATAGIGGPSLTEFAYQPFKTFDVGVKGGQAFGYLASDVQNFYFAAKIADTTPYAGNVRFANRDDDQYFYPEKSYARAGTGQSFATRWTGKVIVPETGTYRFITTSDDGVRLWIDEKAIVDNWTDHGPTENDGLVKLTKGQSVAVRMEYYQGGGGATARLEWVDPHGQRSVMSGPFQAEFYRGRSLDGQPVVVRTDGKVDFTWTATDLPDPKFGDSALEELVWPAGVRRFSYRKDPDLPSGNGTDNVQIAFNILPPERKSWLPHPPGTMDRFITYQDTDYEFALNPVADAFGGGAEIFCLQKPGMMRKHFYPRQPHAPTDGGPVTSGKLVIRREVNTRIVECAIPWTTMPEVKARLDAGQPIKFTYRVNDNKGPAYELAAGRSVSKDNAWTFHNDWAGHWANELEFQLVK